MSKKKIQTQTKKERHRCGLCKGVGYILVTIKWYKKLEYQNVAVNVTATGRTSKEKCDICDGNGYVDWVTNVTGNSRILKNCEDMLKKGKIESFSIYPFTKELWRLNVDDTTAKILSKFEGWANDKREELENEIDNDGDFHFLSAQTDLIDDFEEWITETFYEEKK